MITNLLSTLCDLGQFGSGVASLFIFTRWLLLLNIFLGLLWSALVILPQAVHYNYGQINDVFYMRNVIDGQVGGAARLKMETVG